MSAKVLKKLLAKKQREALPCQAQHAAIKVILHNRYGIDNFYFGAKLSGKLLSRSLSTVCLVDKKLSQRELNKQQLTCLPKTVSLKAGERIKRFKTDVQEFGGPFTKSAADMNPGDNVLGVKGGDFGTIGLFGRHPKYGVVCTTAGHVVREIMAKGNKPSNFLLHDRNQGVQVACTAKRSVMRGQVDYAILRPRQQSDSEFIDLRDHNIVEPYHQPKRSDLSRSLWLLTRGQAVHARFKGIKLDAFSFAGRRYSNVIITESIGQKGDSGAALVDDQYRIWGTLIGSKKDAFSMFMRINTLLENEHFIFGLDGE